MADASSPPPDAADPLTDLFNAEPIADPAGELATRRSAGQFDFAGVVSAPGMEPLPDAPAMDLDPYLAECVALEPGIIGEEFARLPSDFARWNELHAEARRIHLAAINAARRTRARVAMDVRRHAGSYAKLWQIKAVTEGALSDLVELHADVVAAEDAVVKAARDADRIRGVLSALGRKADALVTIGAHQRAEMSLTPHIRTRARS